MKKTKIFIETNSICFTRQRTTKSRVEGKAYLKNITDDIKKVNMENLMLFFIILAVSSTFIALCSLIAPRCTAFS